MMLLEADEQQNDNDNDNNTRAVDDVARDLFLACQQKPLRYDIIQHLLRENPEIAKSKDRQGRLPLEVACLFGSPSLEIVQCLVDHFPAAVEVRTNDNEQRESRNERLPLHYACRGRAPIEVVQYLLEIEPKAIASPGLDGMLPLHEACSSDENDGAQLPPLSLPLIQCLVEKYPNALLVPSSPQLLPLHYASCTKNVPLQVIEYLVKENPNAVEVASHQGLLPLHLAAYFNESSPEVLTLLYESYPAAIEKKDTCGCNPLHVACAASAAPDLIMTIISWHPESLRMEDGFGRLPLHIACLTNAPVSVIKHMAELFPQSLVTKDSEGDGDLALDMICRLGEVSEDVIECLVLDGLPPLHFACCYDASIETLRFLNGKYPAMIAAVAGGDDFCPLHYACCSNSSTENLLEAVDFLLQEDPDGIHAGSSEGELPLHVACKHGKPLELIERLFEKSPVTVKAMDNNGLLPLDVACQNPASELAVIFFLVTKDPGQLLRVKK